MSATLPRNERLRGKDRIGALFERGAVGKSRLVLARALKNDQSYSRVAVIVGKAAGKAFVRIRLRRRLRAAFREQKSTLPKGYDLVLIARRGSLEANIRMLSKDLQKAVERAVEEADDEPEPGLVGRLLILLVRGYQMTLSRMLPRNVCIYEPSCSHYMVDAIRLHGVIKGVAMGSWRICRCHPFAKGGWDPVPLPQERKPVSE